MSHVGLLPRKNVTLVMSQSFQCVIDYTQTKTRVVVAGLTVNTGMNAKMRKKYMTRYVCSSADIHCNCLIR